MRKRGFSLIEVMVVMIIIVIGLGLFYSVFYINTASFDNQVTRVNSWEEVNDILDRISKDIKNAYKVILEDDKNIVLRFIDDEDIKYSITDNGQIQILKETGVYNLASNINYEESFFREDLSAIVINVVIEDNVLGKKIKIKGVTEVIPRN